VAALKYSSQASCPYPPANTTDPCVLSLEVTGLFPTEEITRLLVRFSDRSCVDDLVPEFLLNLGVLPFRI
jgi:hypothetical protein